MPSEDEPTIAVEYFKDAAWISILADIDSFIAKDGGVFSGSSASIKVNNKDGKYTSGSSKIPVYSKVRILGDVRGITDTIFEGRYQQYKGEYKDVKDNKVTLVCPGYEVLLDYYAKTCNWMEQYPQYTYEEVIERILAAPDSFAETAQGTGITLETDSGAIKNQHTLETSSQEPLSSIIREICERINYAGYMKDEGTKLVLKAVGTVPASPAVTLQDPFVYVRPLFDITQVRNYAMPWDDSEPHIPPDERLTEKVMDNYPDAWTPDDAGITLSDSQTQKAEGSYSLEATRNSGSGSLVAKLDCSKVGMGPYIDLTDARFKNGSVSMWFRLELGPTSALSRIQFGLKDTNGALIKRPHGIILPGGGCPMYKQNTWYNLIYDIGIDTTIQVNSWWAFWRGGWFYDEHPSDFNWKIAEVIFRPDLPIEIGETVYIDGLWFNGPKSIDPTIYHQLIKKDAASIAAYGHRTLALSDSTLSSFVNAQALAQYNLDVLKTPMQKVEVKKGAKIWVKPSQTIMLTVPSYEISGTRRIIEKSTEWKNKILRTTFKAVPQYDPVTRRTFMSDELIWLISRK